MRRYHYILFCVGFLLVAFSLSLSGQTNKKFKGKKHSSKREIEKRKREGEERNDADNPYSPVQKSSVSRGVQRDDYIWKAETGNTIYEKSGNVSLFEPSRYGIKDGLELQSYLPLNYFIPNVLIKKRWINREWLVSSRHGIYSATPGFHFAQTHNYSSIIDSGVPIPFVLSFKNELIFSKPFVHDYSCKPNQPLWILNLGIGIDFGIPFENSDLKEIEYHFLANRSAAMTESGYLAYLFAGGIVQINRALVIDASIRYFRGTFSGKNAFEQKTWVELFISSNVSASVGYDLSFATYNNTSPVGFMPMVDFTWYFGKKEGRQKGLFGKKMQ